jgi:hypothetical protein
MIADAIRRRTAAIASELAVVKAAIDREIQRPLREQSRHLLAFLYKEHCVYAFALALLQDLLPLHTADSQDQAGTSPVA